MQMHLFFDRQLTVATITHPNYAHKRPDQVSVVKAHPNQFRPDELLDLPKTGSPSGMS